MAVHHQGVLAMYSMSLSKNEQFGWVARQTRHAGRLSKVSFLQMAVLVLSLGQLSGSTWQPAKQGAMAG